MKVASIALVLDSFELPLAIPAETLPMRSDTFHTPLPAFPKGLTNLHWQSHLSMFNSQLAMFVTNVKTRANHSLFFTHNTAV
ncbi:hypothetical protein [Undibacterium umbellatum]|uniref:Uncharacterized protein n=1 Tax=Undibacterium umbellatum TaxID=2762300 RepID=A0ABR6ZHD2_9BURK|nr:hypothetical protein [Undibacterium umbellatum]MBC3911098.1 hypothetical protein [Undibacterium umbellatum]